MMMEEAFQWGRYFTRRTLVHWKPSMASKTGLNSRSVRPHCMELNRFASSGMPDSVEGVEPYRTAICGVYADELLLSRVGGEGPELLSKRASHASRPSTHSSSSDRASHFASATTYANDNRFMDVSPHRRTPFDRRIWGMPVEILSGSSAPEVGGAYTTTSMTTTKTPIASTAKASAAAAAAAAAASTTKRTTTAATTTTTTRSHGRTSLHFTGAAHKTKHNVHVQAGLQARLDIITPDFPRFNPSMALIDSTTKLSELAAFIGTVRVGLCTYRGSWASQQAMIEGDPKGGVEFRNGVCYASSEHLTRANQAYCEVMLLDTDFDVLAQARIESHVHGQYEDCRVMYLHRGDKSRKHLYVYTTAYHKDLETHLPLPQNMDLSATLRPLDLVVATTESGKTGGSTRRILLQAQYRDIDDPMSICLSDLLLLPGGGEKGGEVVRPLQGKNHVIFEDAGGDTYFVNRLAPLEVYRLVDKEHVEAMAVVNHPALAALSHYSLNGGKAVVMPEFGGDLLMLAHVHAHGVSRYYFHVFLAMTSTPPFRVTRVSHEFCLSSMQPDRDTDYIQYVPCLERVGDVLVLPYGRQDLEAMVFTMEVANVVKMLRPLGQNEESVLRTVGVVEQNGLSN